MGSRRVLAIVAFVMLSGARAFAAAPVADAGAAAQSAAATEASYEQLVARVQRIAEENADASVRIDRLRAQLRSLDSDRLRLLTQIRVLESKLPALAGADRDAARANLARLRAALDTVERQRAAVRARIASEMEQEQAREQERQRIVLAIAAKRPTPKALPPVPK